MVALPPNPRSLVDAIHGNQTTFTEAGGPDAYFGFPADATAEEGQAIVDALGAILEAAVVEAMTGTWRPASAGPPEES
jgi:creatinine amidohydrolase